MLRGCKRFPSNLHFLYKNMNLHKYLQSVDLYSIDRNLNIIKLIILDKSHSESIRN